MAISGHWLINPREVNMSSMLCFGCGKHLQPVTDTGECEMQPWDGTMWSATGNFGSGIYDPGTKTTELLIHVCDTCLLQRIERVHVFAGNEYLGKLKSSETLAHIQ